MEVIELEPILKVPFRIDGKTQKYNIKKLAPKTIEIIQKEIKEKLGDKAKEKEELLKERENLKIRAEFLEKKISFAKEAKELENFEKEFFEIKSKAEEIEKKIEEIEKDTKSREEEEKALCLAAAADENAKALFEKIGEEFGWDYLSAILLKVYREYEKDFL